jgi:hypothetical protein
MAYQARLESARGQVTVLAPPLGAGGFLNSPLGIIEGKNTQPRARPVMMSEESEPLNWTLSDLAV